MMMMLLPRQWKTCYSCGQAHQRHRTIQVAAVTASAMIDVTSYLRETRTERVSASASTTERLRCLQLSVAWRLCEWTDVQDVSLWQG